MIENVYVLRGSHSEESKRYAKSIADSHGLEITFVDSLDEIPEDATILMLPEVRTTELKKIPKDSYFYATEKMGNSYQPWRDKHKKKYF